MENLKHNIFEAIDSAEQDDVPFNEIIAILEQALESIRERQVERNAKDER